MDDDTFDRLARRFESLTSRRASLGALAGTGLLAALGGPGLEGQAKNKGKCKPKPRAVTCRGKCGKVKNNCKKTVDCGTCPVCQRCNAAKVCQPDPDQFGDPCGEEGQVCLDNGTCACQRDPNTCGNGRVCLNGTCQACGFTGGPCCSGDNCQQLRVCKSGICETCGRDAEQCCANQTCDSGRVCVVNTNTCEPCGDLDERCCTTGANPCFFGLTCSPGGFCVE